MDSVVTVYTYIHACRHTHTQTQPPVTLITLLLSPFRERLALPEVVAQRDLRDPVESPVTLDLLELLALL